MQLTERHFFNWMGPGFLSTSGRSPVLLFRVSRRGEEKREKAYVWAEINSDAVICRDT